MLFSVILKTSDWDHKLLSFWKHKVSMRKKPFKPYVYLLYTVCVKTEKESKVIILYFMLEICLCPVDDHSSLCLLEEN